VSVPLSAHTRHTSGTSRPFRTLRRVQQLAEGIWWWTAPHPDWTPEQGGPDGWQQDVSSYAFDCGDTFVLVDPQSPPSIVEELAAGKDVAVVLTCSWHRRSADEVVQRLGAAVHEPDGDLPSCVQVATRVDEDAVLWVEPRGALLFGDTLVGEPDVLRIPDDWLEEGRTREDHAALLRPVLKLPVELALPTHGKPGARSDLERALR
jgi:glyoxylase-like metal-dependent hydrolase (beta-lactamase superfamily II)